MATTPTGRRRATAPRPPAPSAPVLFGTRAPAQRQGRRNVIEYGSDNDEAWSVFEGGRPRSVATRDPRAEALWDLQPTPRPTDRSLTETQGPSGGGSSGGRLNGQGTA